MNDERFSELEKSIVRLAVKQENYDQRLTAIEVAFLNSAEHDERMTEKISAQLTKLNNAVIVIIVTLFVTLGKDVPSLLTAIF